ncbi:M48 family metallopeptidase [Adhaeribacter radiodurans]|uniref:M48 family metallopeptidase n=1 Tax=Adhaeribacter radiodurans TaxID=2745197 RepID=A0A7L7LAG4_9BACT|nr:M48 family metallopeptidase [Adhaeribacter radiodurans]QMU29727.1 M48 family metallopeptidase [Adhaeribacter radiodurans]
MWKKICVYSSFLMVMGCATVPITGRRQLSLVPSAEMQQMSYASYKQVLDTAKVVSNSQNTAMVKRVGQRIQKAVEQYMAQNNLSDQLAGYAWEFNLIEDPQVNAWCMPGGKVAVYTGIIPIVRDETGLAVVMGHEIAHAIAKHGDERMSQGLLQQLGGATLQAAMGSNPSLTNNLFLTAYGAGSQLGLLAYGRKQESEADELGLIFMAMAGYNPQQAVPFWERMAAGKGGQAPPEFLSTHPSDETRIADIQKHIPEALKYYKK